MHVGTQLQNHNSHNHTILGRKKTKHKKLMCNILHTGSI